uniref:Secreted protein n=1 Tax=Rhipicephalus zambeziensis TaxID=60191 RepID=A0A224YBQ0_9ACAR
MWLSLYLAIELQYSLMSFTSCTKKVHLVCTSCALAPKSASCCPCCSIAWTLQYVKNCKALLLVNIHVGKGTLSFKCLILYSSL